MEKSNFDRLMERYLENQVSDEERKKIEAWLDVVKTEDATALELDRKTEEKIFRLITSRNHDLRDILSVTPAKKRRKKKLFYRIAASLVFLMMAAFTLYTIHSRSRPDTQYANAENQRMILSDGTLVWISPGSYVTYHEDKNKNIRYAALEGDALFEVAKDPAKPFVLTCGSISVRVLGTSFHVRSAGDTTEVLVLTGKVNVSADSANAIDLVPSEKGIFVRTRYETKARVDRDKIESVTSGTAYDMNFENVTMADVMKKIEVKFGVPVRAESTVLNTCRITADFTDQSLESTLEMISEVLSLTYDRKGGTITLRGKGCQ